MSDKANLYDQWVALAILITVEVANTPVMNRTIEVEFKKQRLKSQLIDTITL
jgi:hypothetical protein